MQRRQYSDEFKREAVELILQPGVTQAQVARELGVGAGLLGKWVRQFKETGEQAFPGKGHPRDAIAPKLGICCAILRGH